MKFSINRELLLPALQQLNNVVEKRQTLPILNNVLLTFTETHVSLTGTDTELQLVYQLPLVVDKPRPVTVPVRKLMDICRYLPPSSEIYFHFEENSLRLKCQRSNYQLATLTASDFPAFTAASVSHSFVLNSQILKSALDKTHFCIASQDIRYYLNGLLMHVSNSQLKWIASDGHRLAIYQSTLDTATGVEAQLIIPRKAVLELLRLIGEPDIDIAISFSDNHIQFDLPELSLSTKLIDARFPDFSKALQQDFLPSIQLPVQEFCSALNRVAVLAAEQKVRGVTLTCPAADQLLLTLYNQAQEQGSEEVSMIGSDGLGSAISFNVSYLLDAFSHLDSKFGVLEVAENASTGKVYDLDDGGRTFFYIVMPMKI